MYDGDLGLEELVYAQILQNPLSVGPGVGRFLG